MRDGTLFVAVPMKSAFVSFLLTSFFFILLVLLPVLLLRVIVARLRALGKEKEISFLQFSRHASRRECTKRRRRREKENERKSEFRWFYAFLSLFSFSLLSVLNNALMRFSFFVFSTSGKDTALVFDFDFD